MKRMPKIEIVNRCWDSHGRTTAGTVFWWRLKGGNDEVICASETFKTRSNAIRAARRAKQLMAEAEVK